MRPSRRSKFAFPTNAATSCGARCSGFGEADARLITIGELDEAMKAGAGHPMGPLTLADFVGLDTLGSICDVLFDEFRERRFARPPTLRKMLSAGWFGRKAGCVSQTRCRSATGASASGSGDSTNRT